MILNKILLQYHGQNPLCTDSNNRVTVLACSALIPEHPNLAYTSYTRKLCEDRRGVFDHLRPRIFAKNTVRIVFMQSTTMFTNFYSDQLKADIEREERVERKEITRRQADREEEEWMEREWDRRMEALPHKIMVAFAKYHCIVLVMRFYEFLASKRVTEETLDKLTLDTFAASRRTAKVKSGSELAGEMLHCCWKANMISFLADYSVHQVILAFGYYTYIKEQRRRLKSKGDGQSIQAGPLALSFLKRSTLLAFSRTVGLGFASLGGALGSVVWPGWGTLAGTNLGDSLALNMTDDGFGEILGYVG